jgi:hypothetical protein
MVTGYRRFGFLLIEGWSITITLRGWTTQKTTVAIIILILKDILKSVLRPTDAHHCPRKRIHVHGQSLNRDIKSWTVLLPSYNHCQNLETDSTCLWCTLYGTRQQYHIQIWSVFGALLKMRKAINKHVIWILFRYVTLTRYACRPIHSGCKWQLNCVRNIEFPFRAHF